MRACTDKVAQFARGKGMNACSCGGTHKHMTVPNKYLTDSNTRGGGGGVFGAEIIMKFHS